MRILTRYILRAHIGPFIYALSVLTSILLVNSVARRLESLAGKGLPSSVFVEVFLYSVPHVLALTMPMAVLVAVLYTFSQFTAENEITALKASGVNLLRLLAPLVVVATLLAGWMVFFHDRVLPEANHRLANLLLDIARKAPTLTLKEQVINEIQTSDLQTRYFLQAATIDAATNRLKDVVIYDLSDPGRSRTVYADSGRMAFNQDRTDLFLDLWSGWIHETQSGQPERFQRIFFDDYMLRLKSVGNRLERAGDTYRSDREMGLVLLEKEIRAGQKELAQIRTETREQIAKAGAQTLAGAGVPGGPRPAILPPSAGLPPGDGRVNDEMVRQTALQLRVLKDRTESAQDRINQYSVEYHKKFSIPFACIVFVLIGAPLAVRFPRGGVGMVIAISLAIFGIYYVGLIGGETLSDKGLLSPFWSMWAANIVFLVLSVGGLMHIGKETSTTRGGGWDDLWSTLRNLVTSPLRIVGRRRLVGVQGD
ncbi:MAG TPA: LptF/LptG family permease [Longimicrobiales bacterium]|nr:LptF/LptG family permease [Longimicrobiales bacterium]